jgi:hypothetical protein
MKNKRHSVLVEEAKEYFIRSQYLFEYIHTKSETKGKIVSNKCLCLNAFMFSNKYYFNSIKI